MKSATLLQTLAFIPPGLAAAVFLAMSMRESGLGNWNGLTLLVPAVTMILLIILGWKQPFWSGVLMLAVAGFEGYRIFSGVYPQADEPGRALLLVAPLVISGLLQILAAWLLHREQSRRRSFAAALSHRHPG
jgi:hypothetical protein